MTTTFNITPELWQEMAAFSCDSRPRFLYVITHHNPDGSLNMGYSGKKTTGKLSEASIYTGTSSDSLFSKKRILSHRSEYQMHIVGYCRNKEELGDNENALNRYMKGFYKKQWANKNLGNGKNNTEGLIPIIKKGKKIRYVRPEELEHYKSLGWSKGVMFYKMRKEGEVLQEVGEEQVRSLLESGYFFEGHKKIGLHHPDVKGSTIRVLKETGFMEGDVLDALNENFILGEAPRGHQTTADEGTVEKVKAYIVSFRERAIKRMADTNRASVDYVLTRGEDTKPVKRDELIPLLQKEKDWKITSHERIYMHHAKVAGSTISVSGEYMEDDILHAFEAFGKEDFEIGSAPLGHETTADEKTVEKVKLYIEFVRKRGIQRQADAQRASTSYTLKKGDEPPLGFTRYEVLGKLKEDYRFTQGNITICPKKGKYKTHYFEKGLPYKYDRELQHLKLIRLLESGLWQIGMKWEESEEGFLQLEGLSPSILNGWAKGSYKVLIDKEGNEHEVFNTEVLGKLKEDYRFTQKSIDICNKAGTNKPHVFEQKGSNAQTREKQHQKLIRLLESGEWQIGSKWEEPVVVGEPVVAEIEEPVVAVKYDFVALMSMVASL